MELLFTATGAPCRRRCGPQVTFWLLGFTPSLRERFRWKPRDEQNQILRGNLPLSESDRGRFLLGFDAPTEYTPTNVSMRNICSTHFLRF